MRTLALLSVILLSACAASCAPGQAVGQSGAGQGATLARIHALIGTPSCSGDSECRSLALGERPCGGPESYLAYSAARTPEADLRALGEAYRAERRSANTQEGRASDCRFMLDPGAVCRAGTCTLGAAGPVAR